MERFIVAEITKNWTEHTPTTDLLCKQFEGVINRNYARGYVLKDWKITTAISHDKTILSETIIAIFELDVKTQFKQTTNPNPAAKW